MKKILSVMALAVMAVTGWAQMQIQFTPERKLRYAEQIIENYYVDNVDTAKVVTEAIVAMLKTLDPHSTYSSPEETRELTEPLEGNFSGIGIRFQMVNDTLYVIESVAGGSVGEDGNSPGRPYNRMQRYGDCRRKDEKFRHHEGAAWPERHCGQSQGAPQGQQ